VLGALKGGLEQSRGLAHYKKPRNSESLQRIKEIVEFSHLQVGVNSRGWGGKAAGLYAPRGGQAVRTVRGHGGTVSIVYEMILQ